MLLLLLDQEELLANGLMVLYLVMSHVLQLKLENVQLIALNLGLNGDGVIVTTRHKTELILIFLDQRMEEKLVLTQRLSLNNNPVSHLLLKTVHFMDHLVQITQAVLIHSNVHKISV